MTSETTEYVDIDRVAVVLHASYRDAMFASGKWAKHQLLVNANRSYDWQCLDHETNDAGLRKPCDWMPNQHFPDAAEWDALTDERREVWRLAASGLADHKAAMVVVE